MAEHSNRVQSRPIAHGGAVLCGLDCVSCTGPCEGRFGRLFPDLTPLASRGSDRAQDEKLRSPSCTTTTYTASRSTLAT
jgi:hypothetical protein